MGSSIHVIKVVKTSDRDDADTIGDLGTVAMRNGAHWRALDFASPILYRTGVFGVARLTATASYFVRIVKGKSWRGLMMSAPSVRHDPML